MLLFQGERSHIKKGLYFIYGWLKVKKAINHYKDINNPILEERHPHATEAYFLQNKNKNNTIYIADELLFEDSNIPGCGYFPKLQECLLLTDIKQKEGWKPTQWRLPGCLFDNDKCLSVLKNKVLSRDEDRSFIVNARGRWQEAVFQGTQEFDVWFRNLLEKSLCNDIKSRTWNS